MRPLLLEGERGIANLSSWNGHSCKRYDLTTLAKGTLRGYHRVTLATITAVKDLKLRYWKVCGVNNNNKLHRGLPERRGGRLDVHCSQVGWTLTSSELVLT